MGRELWTDKYLDEMRFEADPAADSVVAAVYASHKLDGVNRILMNMVRNTDPPPPEVQQRIDRYFADNSVLPAWIELPKVELAEDLFSRHGMLATTILCCASLPECYLDRADVPVLASTTQLQDHVYRRIWETSHMVITVMQPGGMDPAPAAAPGAKSKKRRRAKPTDDDRATPGEGIRCCLKVRLMHAAIRHLLLANDPPAGGKGELGRALAVQKWDPASGQPINQESMAYVILTFSFVGLRGLDQFGAHPTPEEREAYVHAWSVVGHMMGVHDDLLARNFDDAQYLFETLKRRRAGASKDGAALTKALLEWMVGVMPTGLKHVPRELLVQLVGDKDAAMLGVRLDTDEKTEEGMVAGFLHIFEHGFSELMELPAARRVAEALFHAIVHRVWDMDKGWSREEFALPPSLQKSWSVKRKAPVA
jgi:hypothetical protein